MGTAQMIAMTVIGLAAAALNILYWHRVVTRGDDWARRRVERRYGVTLVRGHRGHWCVTSGSRSRIARLAIELIQLAYFMGAMIVWAVGILVVILIFALLQRAT